VANASFLVVNSGSSLPQWATGRPALDGSRDGRGAASKTRLHHDVQGLARTSFGWEIWPSKEQRQFEVLRNDAAVWPSTPRWISAAVRDATHGPNYRQQRRTGVDRILDRTMLQPYATEAALAPAGDAIAS
jgi:hypothetical protein